MPELTGTVAIDHLVNQVEQLSAVRARIAALQAQEKELVAQVRAGIGTHQIGTIAGEDAVRLDARTASHLDRDAVKALLSTEAFGSVIRHTPYVAVKVVGRFRAAK